MRLVSIDQVKEDMVLAKNIYSADGNVLLAEGASLKKRYIRRLMQLGVASVYVVDDKIGKIEVEELVKEQTKVEAAKAAKEAMENIRGNRNFNSEKIRKVIDDIMEELLTNKSVVVNLTDVRAMNDYTFNHNVAVAVFSMMTGIAMGLDSERVRILGTGAILHDVGKVKVSDLILGKPGKLTIDEYIQVQKHSEIGFEMLRQCDDLDILAAQIALEHHERYNGSGYPKGLAGEEILDLARIVAIADVYDALSTDRVYRNRMSPAEIIECIRSSKGNLFDPYIANVFLEHIAPFPVGSRVLLNNGEIAVVVRVTKELPDRPVVKVITDAGGIDLEEPVERDLTRDVTLFIKKDLNN